MIQHWEPLLAVRPFPAAQHRQHVGGSMAGDRAGDNERRGENLKASKEDVNCAVGKKSGKEEEKQAKKK
jgi:hypothetical protein